MLTTIREFDFFLEQLSTLSASSFSQPDFYLTYIDLMETFKTVPNKKEQEVLQLKQQGYNVTQIAEKLGLHHSSVRERLDKAYYKIIVTLLESNFYDDDEIDIVLDTLTKLETKYKM
jgi:DNA-binding NarL/FixJ family response regulator